MTTTKINLNDHTELEQKFLIAAVNEYNDLMFTDDLNHGIAKNQLGGVVSSLVKKGVIAIESDHPNPAFEFTNDDFMADAWDRKPELVRE